MGRSLRMVALAAVLLATSLSLLAGPASARPNADEIAPPLPAFDPTNEDFEPKSPFPFDQTRDRVTPGDIVALGEMCQWYNAQYEPLIAQIDRFNNNLIRANGDYGFSDVARTADMVVANIDQSVAFLGARTLALTQERDFAGDVYFPIYQGRNFFLLWQHLSNVSAGIHGRQPAWFVGPSFHRVMKWGSEIDRSHVCR